MYYRRLRDLREDNDKKQSEIADILNITQQQYQLYESGKREIPVQYLITLSKLYGKTIDYIVGIEENKQTKAITEKQRKLLIAYKNSPKLQYAIDKLLDI